MIQGMKKIQAVLACLLRGFFGSQIKDVAGKNTFR